MVHLEMSYLTHSKFSNTIIPDIMPLFRARFRIFEWILQFKFFSIRDSNFDVPFLFRTRFGIPDELMLCPSFARGLEFLMTL